MDNLSPPAVDHLLHLVTLLYRRSIETNERGVFTLQNILLTHCTSSFYINSSSFYNHFKNQMDSKEMNYQIGPTILQSSLSDAKRLTNLSLERVCTDSLLKTIGQ